MNKAMVKSRTTGEWEDRSIEALHDAVVECCGAWGLYDQTDFITQQVKGCEEAGEGCKSVNKGRVEQLKDDVGDMLVCIINMCQIDSLRFVDIWHDSLPVLVLSGDDRAGKFQMRAVVHLMSASYPDIPSLIMRIKGLCCIYRIDPVECLGIAYDVISKRTGVMRNGTFIKSEDL